MTDTRAAFEDDARVRVQDTGAYWWRQATLWGRLRECLRYVCALEYKEPKP